MPLQVPSFNHATEWYDYYYVQETGNVCVCHKWLEPAVCLFYNKQHVEQEISFHKFNPFLLPIFQEALKHFPKESYNEDQQVRQARDPRE